MMNNKIKGFTLIELLVVIAIIGILSTILMASFTEARMQSRDKIRMADLKQLQLSLEVYKAQNGVYPAMGCGTPDFVWAGPGPFTGGWGTTCTNYISELVPDYIPALPIDPNQEMVTNRGYIYITNAARTTYKIINGNTVESNFVSSYDNEFARCPRSSCDGVGHCSITDIANSYAVYSAGGECW